MTTTLAKPGGLGGSCHVPPACATTQPLVTVQHGGTKCQWVRPVAHRAWVVVHSLPLRICCRANAAHRVPWLRAIPVQRWLVEGSCKSRFHAADAEYQQKQKQQSHAWHDRACMERWLPCCHGLGASPPVHGTLHGQRGACHASMGRRTCYALRREAVCCAQRFACMRGCCAHAPAHLSDSQHHGRLLSKLAPGKQALR